MQRVCTYEGVVGRQKSQWTTDFSRNSGTYIIYNSHVTCSNSSFSLTMVTPTSHFFAFHWLCCLLPIGYLPKPGSVGVRICTEFNHVHGSRWYSDIFDRMHLFQHPPYSQHLWAWWHFSNHLVDIILERMQLSQHPLIHSTCGHDAISVITPVLSIYLSTTSAVFTPAGHVNILQWQWRGTPHLKPHLQMQFSILSKTTFFFGGDLNPL